MCIMYSITFYGNKWENSWKKSDVSVSIFLDLDLPQSPFTGQFLDDEILLWCLLYIVN